MAVPSAPVKPRGITPTKAPPFQRRRTGHPQIQNHTKAGPPDLSNTERRDTHKFKIPQSPGHPPFVLNDGTRHGSYVSFAELFEGTK